jgi:hypothetical protein
MSYRRPTLAVAISLSMLGLPAGLADATPAVNQPIVSEPAAAPRISAVPDQETWQAEITPIIAEARAYLESTLPNLPEGTKPAIVLDIDNTSLATHWEPGTNTPPARATLELARWAHERGVSIQFITGRNELLRPITENNLKSVGYPIDGLHLYSPFEGSVQDSKTSTRKELTEKDGYRIVANIGNNDTDLAGGYADKGFLLPNYDGELE